MIRLVLRHFTINYFPIKYTKVFKITSKTYFEINFAPKTTKVFIQWQKWKKNCEERTFWTMKWIVEYFYCYNSNEMYCVVMNMFTIVSPHNTHPYGSHMNERLWNSPLFALKSVIQIGIVMLHSAVYPIPISCNSRIDARFFWLSAFKSKAHNSN